MPADADSQVATELAATARARGRSLPALPKAKTSTSNQGRVTAAFGNALRGLSFRAFELAALVAVVTAGSKRTAVYAVENASRLCAQVSFSFRSESSWATCGLSGSRSSRTMRASD